MFRKGEDPMTDVEMLANLGAQPQIVKSLFEAVARRDQVALLEAYHPDIAIHEAASLPYGGDYHGHEGAIAHVQAFYRTWEGLKPRELLEEARREHPLVFLETTQDYVVVLGQNTAVAPQSGRKLDLPEVWVFKMREDKIAESWMLNQDTVAILDFLKEAQKSIFAQNQT
jgi:uncharacterized protein